MKKAIKKMGFGNAGNSNDSDVIDGLPNVF